MRGQFSTMNNIKSELMLSPQWGVKKISEAKELYDYLLEIDAYCKILSDRIEVALERNDDLEVFFVYNDEKSERFKKIEDEQKKTLEERVFDRINSYPNAQEGKPKEPESFVIPFSNTQVVIVLNELLQVKKKERKIVFNRLKEMGVKF